jgi:tRNA (adenine22-N1)-methyltransferase
MARTTTNFSKRVGEGLSLRLRTLQSYYSNEQVVWDIGCDHGQLGLSFADVESVKSIQLVDPSEKVISTLHNKLKDSYISVPKINVHHNEGQRLKIESPSNLIFIAGMGGLEIGEIVSNLYSQLNETSKFVISPHRKILEVRALLNELPVSLLSEEVIVENGQFYQILELGLNPNGMKVSLYGTDLWKTPSGEDYRKYQLKYFDYHKDLASQEYVKYLKSLNPSESNP